MPIDSALRKFVARVAAFHITDRATVRVQRSMQMALDNDCVDENTRRHYFQAVHRYFSAFEKEARAHLRDVDKRLEKINQVQFNLTAERAVAVKRIEVTGEILQAAHTFESFAE